MLTIDQEQENPNPSLSLKEKGPSIYSDKVSLDKGKFLVTNNDIYQPDATASTEIITIDPHAEGVNPSKFAPKQLIGEAVVDHDGSATAYIPGDIGSDQLKYGYDNKGREVGLVKKSLNHLGGYLSTTSFQKGPSDRQSSHIDSRRIPYVAMSGSYFEEGGHHGDFVKLTNKITKKTIWAIVADNRKGRTKGVEMSIAAATALGVEFNRRATTKNYQKITLEAYKGSASGKFYE